MERVDYLIKETITALEGRPTNKRTSNPTPEIFYDQKNQITCNSHKEKIFDF
jgi:hypothetical protein